MSGNTFGVLFRVTTFGESHGKALGAVIDGCPPNLDLAEADIQEHIAVALIQMKGDTLQRLREALVRLETGEYGDCADCVLQVEPSGNTDGKIPEDP